MKENKCVCCNATIPEGGHTCKKCIVESFKPKAKIKATAKINELKNWVYKHFIGVYIAIGITVCLIMLTLGIIIGQAIGTTASSSDYQTHVVTAEQAMSSYNSAHNIELVFRSSNE